MDETANKTAEQNVAAAFNKQASKFDELYSANLIIQYKRERVRTHVAEFILPESNILELNAGTGEDAVYFAKRGHCVHATDIAEGMQRMLNEKVKQNNLCNTISTEICSFTALKKLQQKGPYDLIFSNFAGLNCTKELEKVLPSFYPLLKPGGFVTLVIMPKFCLWETALFFKGHFKTAFRRFTRSNVADAQIEGLDFICRYYSPSFVIDILKKEFTVLKVEGLCAIVPPSYFENFPAKHKILFEKMKTWENKLKSKWPWKYCGDYYIISLRKK